jgi:hypothetical protein
MSLLINKHLLPLFALTYFFGAQFTLFILSLFNFYKSNSSVSFILLIMTLYLNIYGFGNLFLTLILILISVFSYYFTTIKTYYSTIRNIIKLSVQLDNSNKISYIPDTKDEKGEIEDLKYINDVCEYCENKVYSVYFGSQKIFNFASNLFISRVNLYQNKVDSLLQLFDTVLNSSSSYIQNIGEWLVDECKESKYFGKIMSKVDSVKMICAQNKNLEEDVNNKNQIEQINMPNFLNTDQAKLLEKEMDKMFNNPDMNFNDLLNNNLFSGGFGELGKLLSEFQKDIEKGDTNNSLTDSMVDEDIGKLIDTVNNQESKKKGNKKKTNKNTKHKAWKKSQQKTQPENQQ